MSGTGGTAPEDHCDERIGGSHDEHEPDYRFTLANERTFLACVRRCRCSPPGSPWSSRCPRSPSGVAANAVLLAVREIGDATLSVALVPATLGLLIAVATAVYGRRRTALLRDRPLPVPYVAVTVLGVAVVALAVLAGPTVNA